MDSKEKRKALNLIKAAYGALHGLDSITFTPYRTRLLEMCKEEERLHRSGSFWEGRRWGLSVPDAARLFAVKRIAEALAGELPNVADVIKLQPSVFYAASIALTYPNEVRTAWAKHGIDAVALRLLDYAELVA